jgi:biopolymer transport protein TolQ
MSSDLSLIGLFLNASLLVKLVMLMLFAGSVVSWALIFQRWQVFKISQKMADEFENTFWSGVDLNKLYQSLSSQRKDVQGSESIFLAGFKEFVRLRKQSVPPDAIMEGAQRSMRVAMGREVDRLEMHLTFLATVGSVSPYVGLFGTVWGIMNSFRALGSVQQATLSMVAPGISEALVATAIGLFAAIPAVVAYNRYSHRLQSLTNQYANFLEEFTSILHRQAHGSSQVQSQAQTQAHSQAQAYSQAQSSHNLAKPQGSEEAYGL